MRPPAVRWSAVEYRARSAVGPDVHRSGGDDDLLLSGLATDSRAVTPGCLFACVRGATSDGHRFAPAAVAAGAAALVVDSPVELAVPQLLVLSVRAVLGALGALLAGDPAEALRLVGITGTNGKTTTGALVHGALQSAGAPAGVVGTVGARVGDRYRDTALTTPEAPELHRTLAWMRGQGADSAVVEMSSIALDVGRVDGLTADVAVFTGFEEEHLDHHGTVEHYWASKARLFEPERAREGVVVLDGPWSRRLAHQARIPLTLVGTAPDAHVRVLGWRTGLGGTEVVLADADGRHRITSPLVGQVHVTNLAAAWATGRRLGLDPATVTAGLATTRPPRGRNTVLGGGARPLVLIDYAHTPDAVASALATARDLCRPGGRVHLVLGARGRRDRYKREAMGAAARAADLAWLTTGGSFGEDPRAVVEALRLGLAGGSTTVRIELDRRAAITGAVAGATGGDVVLVVGRGHETRLQDTADPAGAVHLDDAEVACDALESGARQSGEVRTERAS